MLGVVDLLAGSPTGRAAVSCVDGDVLALGSAHGHDEPESVGLGDFGRGALCGVVVFVALVKKDGFPILFLESRLPLVGETAKERLPSDRKGFK
jgi:hypothetical protein